MIGVSANSPTQRNPRAASARLSVNLTISIAAVAAVVLGACGSLEEIGTGRTESDGGSGAMSGGPTSPFVPQPRDDGGAVGPTDAQSPVRDAGFFDSGAVVDAGTTDAGSPPPPPPKRVVFIYTSHGFSASGRSGSEWKPTGSRSPMSLTGRLAPLMPFRDQMVLVDGLNAVPVPTDSDRPTSCANYTRVPHGGCERSFFGGSHPELTRSPDDHLAATIRSAADPVVLGLLGRSWGGGPPPRISIDEDRLAHPIEIGPLSYFDNALQRLNAVVSPSSAATELLRALQSSGPGIQSADGTDHARFLTDAIAVELAHDTTRVFTLVLGYDELFLPELVGWDIPRSSLLPTLNNTAHRGSDQFEQYQRWFVSEVAHLAHTLNRLPEGSGTVLDNTLIVWFTDSGTIHNSVDDVPAILIGSALSTLPLGEYVTVDNGRLIDLFTTIGVGFGVPEGAMGHPSAPGRVLLELVR